MAQGSQLATCRHNPRTTTAMKATTASVQAATAAVGTNPPALEFVGSVTHRKT